VPALCGVEVLGPGDVGDPGAADPQQVLGSELS
jgi:hypothetical protein